MSWLGSFLVAVLTSAVAAVAGGFVASACVDWYRISPREGGAGYFVVAIVLLSGFAGFLEGFILSRFAGGAGTAGFFKGLGICAGSMLVLAAASATLAWSLADIPPTINGRDLDLLVEVRLPKGATPPAATEGHPFILFQSAGGPGRPARASQNGVLDVSKAVQADGRWVIPGSVPIFTTRGTRILVVVLDDKHATGFEVSFPGHPGPRYEQWSGWLPTGTAAKPWPDTEMSYRFSIQPEKTPQEISADIDKQLAALSPDAPLEACFAFFTNGRDPDRDHAVAKLAEARPADLAAFLRSPDPNRYQPALYAANLMGTIDPQVVQAMRDVAAGMEANIRKLQTMSPQQPEYATLSNETRQRFDTWMNSWGSVCRGGQVDCRQPVETILHLASAQKDDSAMKDVAALAQALLGNLPPPPPMPQ